MTPRPREILHLQNVKSLRDVRVGEGFRAHAGLRKYALAMLAAASAFVAASTFVVSPASAGEPRAVLELFTSQGCSSCPAADRLVGELTKDPSVIALSMPIDYWDYLGWKDTLASPKNTARQRGYARARGDRQVYTPQMVVNGRVHALGSDKAAIERAISASHDGSVLSVPVKLAVSGGTLSVKISTDAATPQSGEIWLCAISRQVPVEIGKGENRGHTVIYNNVVRSWVKLGDWDGKAGSWNVPVMQFKTADIDAAAIIVQGGPHDRPSTILGAALAMLPHGY